tara:strand:- start:1124 stop:1867 length:744 start_codon:yes stop_codon:yes gene_type:complete
MIGAPTLSKAEICLDKPSSLSAHRSMHQERWGEFANPYPVGKVVCERGGTIKTFDSTLTPEVYYTGLWATDRKDSEEYPFKAKCNVGKEYLMNAEIMFETSRNWPAFTGFSFESYNTNSNNSHTMYLRYVATIWVNDAGEEMRVAAVLNGSNNADGDNTEYFWNYKFVSSSPEIQTQQEGYRLCGFLFNYRTKSGTGGSSNKSVEIYNLRLHTNPEDMPDGTRVVLPKMVEFNEDAVGGPIQIGDAA